MAEPVVGPSPSEYVEEKTEPFSQSEIHARRLQKSVRLEEISVGLASSVPLDTLVVPPDKDIRILVRPLTRSRSVSPGSQDNCEWLALHAEVAEKDQPQHKVLAVTQTSRDIKFSVRVPTGPNDGASTPRPPLWCELYYDPASDNQILVNRSDLPINLSRVSQQPATSPGGFECVVNPGSPKALSPGTWRINVNDVDVLDFRILEKRHMPYRVPSTSSSEASTLSDMVNSSGKRSFLADDEEGPDRKLRITEASGGKDDGVIMFLRPKTDPLVFPLPTASNNRKELQAFTGHALLEMKKDETVEIPAGCEMESYTITKGEPIASTSLSTVFKGNHSSVPEETIVVKVLKTRPPASSSVVTKPQEAERNVIRQADIWLREFQQHSKLEHGQIARLYGGDARYLSLYMEHVPSRDLTSWVDPSTDHFRGDRNDAIRILHDMAGALHYIHGRNLVHNDIKPANILYSRERGAVLCDMGMSTHASNPATSGGTPYYVPPEFIGHKLRGAAGDVYALGVTMLFILRKIAFPDARGRRDHPKRLYWVIAELNRPPRYHRDGGAATSAVAQMQQWLNEVNEARTRLNRKDKLERIVHDMVAPQPSQRITMRQVMKEFTAKQAEK
ncbi:kinase-like domain-containing protein [Coniochaeta sp. 2T2.1]|nr:kinase-like domain-containing protein [Coniochaeta sp. 2T2.1]